jgi:hypothetical protein
MVQTSCSRRKDEAPDTFLFLLDNHLIVFDHVEFQIGCVAATKKMTDRKDTTQMLSFSSSYYLLVKSCRHVVLSCKVTQSDSMMD